MGREDRGPLVLRRLAAHGEMIPVHRIETRIAIPGFVEMDAVGTLLEQSLGAHRVVAQPVIGAVGDDGIDRLLAGDRLGQCARLRLAADGLGIHLRR
jgi:hypothetical protein